MKLIKPKKAKQKSLTHFHLAQGGRNFEEVHDISSLKLANLLSTMENLESLQLSSLLSTYDQGQGRLTVYCEGIPSSRGKDSSLESHNFHNLSNNRFYDQTQYTITR